MHLPDPLRRLLTLLGAVVLPLVVGPWLLLRRLLRADEELTRWDRTVAPFEGAPPPDGAHDEVSALLLDAHASFPGRVGTSERLAAVRTWLDDLGDEVLDGVTLRAVDTSAPDDHPVRGEWVLADDHDPDRRLLYLHGGSFQAGSPRSHRSVTSALAARTGAAVFALDYRLQPEHGRREILADVDAAWRWLCATGPDGPAPAERASIAGDSAGGTLTLVQLLHLRDTCGRRPDAAVVFAPGTDGTLSGDSWRDNRDTDPFLGPSVGKLLELPQTVLMLALWRAARLRPTDPRVSPLLAELHDLPPVLVQLSDVEMLHDDGVRFATKAQAAGSPVELQVWPGMVHVFQAFTQLPQAGLALDEAARFIAAHGAAAERGDVVAQAG